MARRSLSIGSGDVHTGVISFGMTEVLRKCNAVAEVLLESHCPLPLVHGQSVEHPIKGLLVIQGYSDKEKL